MQSEVHISESHVADVIAEIFAQGTPIAYESYSEPEQEIRSFSSALELEAEISLRVPDERRFVSYSIHYPEAKGLVKKRKFDLIPEKNDGKRFRFSMDGWGLIQLQLTYSDDHVSCRVAVNSEKRALAWLQTYPDHGDPSLWDWKIVEKHARRIIRKMKKEPNQPLQTMTIAVTSAAAHPPRQL